MKTENVCGRFSSTTKSLFFSELIFYIFFLLFLVNRFINRYRYIQINMKEVVSPKSSATSLATSNGDGSIVTPKGGQGSPNMLKVSTINNDIRIGRSSSIKNNGLASSLSNVRNNRSPNHSRHGSIVGDDADKLGPNQLEGSTNLRKLSNEQIIDLMEKEQDGIVVKLMKDINTLKQELHQWKTGVMPTQLRSPSFDHRLSVVSSTSSVDSVERERIRRRSSNEAPPAGSFFDNGHLVSENNRLKQENDLLRQKLNELNKLNK